MVADGYISGAKVFHDLNENGVFDEGIDVSVQSQNNGSFFGLHGDVAKPLVAIGGIDTSTGLPFQSKLTDGSFSDIVLYSAANATVINPLTSLVFKMEKQNQNAEILTFDFDNSSSTFTAKINNSVVNTNLYDLKIIFSNGANDVDSYVLNGTSTTETEFSDKVNEIFGETVNAFDGVRLGLLQKGTETLVLETNTFNSLESAKTSIPTSPVFSSDLASALLVNGFSKLSSLSDVYNYDPIANNDVSTQALSSQIANLMVSIPYLLPSISNSNQVLDILVNHLLNWENGDPTIDLGNQTDLETLFNVDNTPLVEGDPAPNILQGIALANKSVGDATSIEFQTFGLIAARDELIEERVTRDLTSTAPDFQATEEDEKFIGSADDDIIFGAGGDDIFGGGTDLSSINEGDIFVGGTGKDAVVLFGKEEDYIFMIEDPGSNTYNAIELMLDQET